MIEIKYVVYPKNKLLLVFVFLSIQIKEKNDKLLKNKNLNNI